MLIQVRDSHQFHALACDVALLAFTLLVRGLFKRRRDSRLAKFQFHVSFVPFHYGIDDIETSQKSLVVVAILSQRRTRFLGAPSQQRQQIIATLRDDVRNLQVVVKSESE